jgi:hypothetical protein
MMKSVFQKDVNKNYKVLSKFGFTYFDGIKSQEKECIKLYFDTRSYSNYCI